ncbi:hypothetical protein ACFFX0_08130 [Citricoccus parietis]|uniref:Uncharacterized protein n=1 Tax=Citricoccus parietis TaxID=592307 RepID=A0ABV5FWU8_9MICC
MGSPRPVSRPWKRMLGVVDRSTGRPGENPRLTGCGSMGTGGPVTPCGDSTKVEPLGRRGYSPSLPVTVHWP